MYLLTCPHGTIAGVFRLPDGYACEDLQWSPERVVKAFRETISIGFANRCETTKWVWIRKHFEWNKPENPNQRKAVAKIAAQVPQECAWHKEFIEECAPYIGAEIKPFRNPSETLSEPVAVAVDKEEAKASLSTTEVADPSPPPVKSAEDGASSVPACPHEKLLDLWATHCPTMAQPRRSLWQTSGGADAMRQRWRWVLTTTEGGQRLATTAEEGLDWFARFFAYIATCPHLVGRNDRDWQADLKWCMTAGNFAKIMQGNYEPRREAA